MKISGERQNSGGGFGPAVGARVSGGGGEYHHVRRVGDMGIEACFAGHWVESGIAHHKK